ncbi:DUF1343 domain-containing protein [Aliiglaciecola sp. CAU 1673]|uniref:exo-beta-N-acetylmuramidase NamZ family protein n=1 Tax=Aliiglaciecola sp. CAU 1673 TaxID=3032595 RepID=UPI0023DBF870|nr:DUF1343 domain-containing protein [Aliiglaciecola sp. CAU 1673]MDF2176676.1 DUF1343 domain-containing protein [Aliiglaciecola sp. CAU 1673]
MPTVFLLIFCGFLFGLPALAGCSADSTPVFRLGAEQSERYLPQLKDKRIGLIVNQTARVGEQHLLDFLLESGVKVARVFAPEHGFRGEADAGASIDGGVDSRTGTPIYSIYGERKQPAPDALNDLDILVFDIQDVGVRYYTYISSMHLMMEAAADAGLPFMVLDRPNPNGAYVDGPVLEPAFRSFVGMHEIPLLHGMTVGELAQMIVGEGWLKSEKPLSLSVIPMQGYQREMSYDLPIKPSPNLPNAQAVALYPSLGFFEATPISIGRGTDFPFQVIGHDTIQPPGAVFSFTPVSKPGASKPKLQDTPLLGEDLRQYPANGLDLSHLLRWYQVFAKKGEAFFDAPAFMDKLAGTDKLRLAIEAGQSEAEIRASWQPKLDGFNVKRQAYLLYP